METGAAELFLRPTFALLRSSTPIGFMARFDFFSFSFTLLPPAAGMGRVI
jgi:hypothetical protein